jgi:UDP-glucuronate decarboxylase
VRVLLTGAAGFFGAHAARHLANVDLVATDHPAASLERIGALAPSASVTPCDAADLPELVARVKPDVCIHLAWYAVPGRYWSAVENVDHVGYTLGLAKALATTGCRRLVTAGTCAEYDATSGCVSEASPTAPRFLYSAAKNAVYGILHHAAREWNMAYCHVRFFYQYGPWEAPQRLVPTVVRSLLEGAEARVTTGEHVRDFLHVDDVARALVTVAQSELTDVVNIGSGVPVKVREVVAATARACGREDLVRYGAVPTPAHEAPILYADVAKLASTGFRPRFDLESGVRDTVAWHVGRSKG